MSYARLERPHLLHSSHKDITLVFMLHEPHALAEHQANRANIALVGCTLEMQGLVIYIQVGTIGQQDLSCLQNQSVSTTAKLPSLEVMSQA